jgi:hypothetical protein
VLKIQTRDSKAKSIGLSFKFNLRFKAIEGKIGLMEDKSVKYDYC